MWVISRLIRLIITLHGILGPSLGVMILVTLKNSYVLSPQTLLASEGSSGSFSSSWRILGIWASGLGFRVLGF